MVSNASEDLPEPDNPVNTISASRGISRSTFFRLCSRAPRTWIVLCASGTAGLLGLLMNVGLTQTPPTGNASRGSAHRREGRLNGPTAQMAGGVSHAGAARPNPIDVFSHRTRHNGQKNPEPHRAVQAAIAPVVAARRPVICCCPSFDVARHLMLPVICRCLSFVVGGGDEVRILLGAPLKCQKIIVAASAAREAP